MHKTTHLLFFKTKQNFLAAFSKYFRWNSITRHSQEGKDAKLFIDWVFSKVLEALKYGSISTAF